MIIPRNFLPELMNNFSDLVHELDLCGELLLLLDIESTVRCKLRMIFFVGMLTLIIWKVNVLRLVIH